MNKQNIKRFLKIGNNKKLYGYYKTEDKIILANNYGLLIYTDKLQDVKNFLQKSDIQELKNGLEFSVINLAKNFLDKNITKKIEFKNSIYDESLKKYFYKTDNEKITYNKSYIDLLLKLTGNKESLGFITDDNELININGYNIRSFLLGCIKR